MAIFDEKTLTSHLRGPEHIQWLESQLGKPDPNPVQENLGRSYVRMEMISAEIYHGLAWFLQAYPQVARVRPIWEPFMEPSDRTMLVRVRLEIDSTVPADREDAKARQKNPLRTRDPLDAYYSYEDGPPSISDDQMGAFNTLVELCEQVGPEIWEVFVNSKLDKNKGYTSQDQVFEEMDSELGPFLDKLTERVMGKVLPAPSKNSSPKSKGPGSRV